MPRLKWEQEFKATKCYTADKKHFFGSYWDSGDFWTAHICPTGIKWYIKQFPRKTTEKEIKSTCQRLINHFKEEKDKWQED